MKTMQQNRFLGFLKEIAIVVIGVLIAVSINNLNEDIGNKKYIKKTLEAIEKEIVQNKGEIEKVVERHQIIADSLLLQLDSKESLSKIIFGLGGIQSAETKNIGLRFFISNKADLVDYEVISNLSDIETMSNLLDEKMKRLIDYMFDKIEKRDRIAKEKFYYHLNNVINSERGLLTAYSNYAEKSKVE